MLVTGANGWLGQRVARLIVQGDVGEEIRGVLPQPLRVSGLLLPGEAEGPLKTLGVNVMKGDIRSPRDCAAFCEGGENGVLIHTAGLIHPRRIRDFYEVNRDGTRNILQAAVAAKVRRAVVVSSNSAIGVNPSREHRFDESSPYHPYMNYGRSKMQMELTVREFDASGQIETVIVRAPWFYGPGQPTRQTLFFSMIRTGKVPVVGSGSNLRSMAYVDNLCDGLLLAAFSARARGQTYWIADSKPYSMNEIVDTVEELLEREFHLNVAHKRLRLPAVLSEMAMATDALLQGLGFYNQKIHVLSEMNKTIACNVEKAVQELNYRPKIALGEGMRRSIADCLARGIEI